MITKITFSKTAINTHAGRKTRVPHYEYITLYGAVL